jgi:hypothetical protein
VGADCTTCGGVLPAEPYSTAIVTPGKSTNLGAIIGGVVGGAVAALLVVVAVMVFVMRRNRRREQEKHLRGLQAKQVSGAGLGMLARRIACA